MNQLLPQQILIKIFGTFKSSTTSIRIFLSIPDYNKSLHLNFSLKYTSKLEHFSIFEILLENN